MKLFLIGLAFIASACAQLSSEYLPPGQEYGGAASNVVETNFLESEPAHTLDDEGYRYKTVKRLRFRRRRDVSNDYLPPLASAPEPVYSAPAAYESAPAPSYSAPSYETYDTAASEPAHSFSADDGYRYRSVKRYRLRRRRRDVSELSNDYLPPHAASAPEPVYSAPAAYESAPAPSYSAPASSYETYDVAASEPAHTFSSNDGYRYRAVKRYRLRRRRRDVNELSNDYLPPHAASAPEPVYSAPAAYESAPAPSYSAPSYESYDTAASEPAHTFSADDGYRYRSVKRYRLRRRRRDVSELSNDYLPPHAASAPGPVYSAPAAYELTPAPSFSAPSYETYDVAASEPAHSFSSTDGYRYKTVKRFRHRRRRDVN